MSKKQTNFIDASIEGLHYVGVDVSKDGLDLYHEINGQGNHCVIKNTKSAIEGYCAALLRQYPSISVQSCFSLKI